MRLCVPGYVRFWGMRRGDSRCAVDVTSSPRAVRPRQRELRYLSLVKNLRLLAFGGILLACGQSRESTEQTRPDETPLAPPEETSSPRYGIAVGEFAEGTAIWWAQGTRAGSLCLEVAGEVHRVALDAERDFTTRLRVQDLPSGRVRYRAWIGHGSQPECGSPPADAVAGAVRIPGARSRPEPVRFVFSGDLAGQNACRDEQQGFPALRSMVSRRADFAIALGDMIYADSRCEAEGRFRNAQVPGEFGPATSIEEYRAHWHYAFDDEDVLRLRRSFYPVWDDHETINDVGPSHDVGGEAPYDDSTHLLPIATSVFRELHPVDGEHAYRSSRWGRHLELFFLDTRCCRDANAAPDTGDEPKTMLGPEQITWLRSAYAQSDATWRIIVSSVPVATPTGYPPERGHDGWANGEHQTGFERELLSILRHMHSASPERPPIWITTDVHFASVTQYRPFPEEDDDFVFLETVVGPLSAGLFPNRELDPTLNPERLFFHGPTDVSSVETYEEAVGWFNFGEIAIARDGDLSIRIFDGRGRQLFTRTLPVATD